MEDKCTEKCVKNPDFDCLEETVMKLASDITVVRLYARDTLDYMKNKSLPDRVAKTAEIPKKDSDNRIVDLENHVRELIQEIYETHEEIRNIRKVFTNE